MGGLNIKVAHMTVSANGEQIEPLSHSTFNELPGRPNCGQLGP
jgi:hypothetical protein